MLDRIWLMEGIEILSKTGLGKGTASAVPERLTNDE
jgi:hypothetical protein